MEIQLNYFIDLKIIHYKELLYLYFTYNITIYALEGFENIRRISHYPNNSGGV